MQFDETELEALKATLQSPGWKLIATRIQHAKVQAVNDLTQDQPELGTAKKRGFIEGLTTALAIPDILMAEAKRSDQ
jgi:hypothetical protein